MMKQAVNFRLSQQTMYALSLLEEKLHASKTRVVEIALQAYAKQKLPLKNTLLAYAGVLGENEAENLLHHIKTNRRNKAGIYL